MIHTARPGILESSMSFVEAAMLWPLEPEPKSSKYVLKTRVPGLQ